MSLDELWRRIKNIIVTASVVETQMSDGKALVKVKYTDGEDEHLSDWLPVKMKSNSKMKIWMPIAEGEQVIVFRPMGDNDKGFVVASIFNVNSKEPVGANANTAIVEFSDGCTIKYDMSSKELSVDSCTCIRLNCSELVVSGSCDIGESLDVGGDISTEGTVTDAMGDLTNFLTTNGGERA